jgi:UDP-N-acetylmuramate dehydrogenase
MSAAYSLAKDVPLRGLNTFGVQSSARWFATLRDASALSELLALPEVRGGSPLVLGEGSNILFAGDVQEAVLQAAFADANLVGDAGDAALVRVDAAMRWDALVDWTLVRGLSGLENLALIPGLVGAAPIQNIGAYGVEVAEFIQTVEAYDRQGGRIERLGAAQCNFGYRDSLFKRDADRWIVCAVELRLPKQRAPALDYAGVREELAAMGVVAATAADVAVAVRRLRRRKLPDPTQLGNAGSFFKNPVVSADVAVRLQEQHPGLPVHPAAGGPARKLSAAWLIEACGWRGYREGDAGVSAQHALVLVNHGHATGVQILSLARRVAVSVQERFGVPLEPEPRIVGARF